MPWSCGAEVLWCCGAEVLWCCGCFCSVRVTVRAWVRGCEGASRTTVEGRWVESHLRFGSRLHAPSAHSRHRPSCLSLDFLAFLASLDFLDFLDLPALPALPALLALPVFPDFLKPSPLSPPSCSRPRRLRPSCLQPGQPIPDPGVCPRALTLHPFIGRAWQPLLYNIYCYLLFSSPPSWRPPFGGRGACSV